MTRFADALREQRHDDHRLYHQSRINQALHLVSATSFLVAYALLLIDPPLAALVAWLVGMTTRQIGHFFFEPKSFDHVNDATHAHKEAIKVGYNLRRKVFLMAIWAMLPVILLADPSLFGLIEPHDDWRDFVRSVGLVWLILGLAGVAFRMAQLLWREDLVASLAWATKIATDPFYDVKLYWRAPLQVLRGELFSPEWQEAAKRR